MTDTDRLRLRYLSQTLKIRDKMTNELLNNLLVIFF